MSNIEPGYKPMSNVDPEYVPMRELRAPWVEELTVSNARNEYTEDLLARAAEIVWLVADAAQNVLNHWSAAAAAETLPEATIGEPTPEWIAAEVRALRERLASGGPPTRSGVRRDVWRWRALCILNVPRILASSSRAREGGAS